jgi:NADPH-dependent 2,4-dienoyl-CoA reductase/sulfur reductase-like enzyme/nitrite reductase/ring-hydroxylating ferredoxin subunit
MAGEVELSGPDLRSEGIPVEEIVDGGVKTGQVDGLPVVIVATDDEFHVVGGRCSHYGGPLGEGICVEGTIRCPWHHAAFDVKTGEAVAAPALDPLAVYLIEKRDGRIFVTDRSEAPAPSRTPPAPPESVVIVGSGAAGAVAAEQLRAQGYEGSISLIGEEPPIDRPNVSKDFLAGTAPEEWMPLRSPGFYSDAGIDLITGRRVNAIDTGTQTVRMADEGHLSYGALLLATGAEPRKLKVPGADIPHVHYLRTLEDSKTIIATLDSVRRAVIIGAGFIGLEVAASLRHRGIDVAVIAPEEVPLANAVGETLGSYVAELHREHGVEFHLGRNVVEVTENEVLLDDKTQVPADLVVVGIGVIPRTELAAAAGLTVDNGIVVDDRLRTSDPHIWAAGDVARYPGPAGELVRIEHWVLAERQGQTVARNILGHDLAFTRPPFFWSQHYDIPINVSGHVAGWDEEVVKGDPHQRDVLVGYLRAGKITAVASIYRDRDSLRAEHALASGDQETLRILLGA